MLRQGITPVQIAVIHGQVEVLELLLMGMAEADDAARAYSYDCGSDNVQFAMAPEAMRTARSTAAGVRRRDEEDDRLSWMDRLV